MLNKITTRTFHRKLYAGELETITLLKRNDDQGQTTVRSLKIFNVRKSPIVKTGQTIQGEMSSDERTVWHLFSVELENAGVDYINNLDRIVDSQGRYWQPESTVSIVRKLFENESHVECMRVDPKR